MPPARITRAYVTKLAANFINDVVRARELYQKIVVEGFSQPAGTATPTRLSQPDTRDSAQFIFFEIAAKFEEFAKLIFQAEVRAVLKVTAKQSEYIMGDPDNGLSNKLGWGSPKKLKERGQNLFGKTSFFAKLDTNLGTITYGKLIEAHTIRNRLAYSGGNAQVQFVKMLANEGISKNERQGMSVGRYIKEYPVTVAITDKHFFVILRAYEEFAQKSKAALP